MSALFNPYKEDLLDRIDGIDFDSDTIECALVEAGYTFTAAHDFRDDITNVSVAAADAALASKTVTDGVADAGTLTYTAPGAGAAVTQLILYKNVGTAATDNLIAQIDGFSSVTPNGTADITVDWNASGIFAF